ncbi:MAG: HAD family hydrolase [Planctomycetota bacterium]|jgi:D-glycero-D-manno-heptose 1,7-bisphosphate phosphatase|nr:HAD family hydrolase [Planctomycetota bacterium]
MPSKKRFILLDRDGTITRDQHYQKDPELTELLPGSREGLVKLAQAGYALVLVTNQSGIAQGLLSLSDLQRVNQRLADILLPDGVQFAGMYFCPHQDKDHCHCRKPKPGMAEQAGRELGFDPREAVVVGDRPCDIGLGKAIGGKTVLVRKAGDKGEEGGEEADWVAADLLAAADWIIANIPG